MANAHEQTTFIGQSTEKLELRE